MPENKITPDAIRKLKNVRKIAVLTAYDFPTALLLDKAGLDIVLIGDSLANVVLGLESTAQIGMDEMIHHSKAVSKGVKNALIAADMPFSAYQVNTSLAVSNAKRFIEEAGCDCVKVEWFSDCVTVVKNIKKANIECIGHIGLTPQTAHELGGFKVQGKDAKKAQELIKQAQLLEDAGCFSIVLECIPDKISEIITKKIAIPTIGIGAGIHCDGQVLVLHDLLGFYDRSSLKFVKQYLHLSETMLKAFTQYKEDVLENRFPGKEHSFTISEEELKKITDA